MPPTGTYQGMAKVVLVGSIHGQVTNNVLFFGLKGELGSVDWPARLQELATALMSCAVTHLIPVLSSDFSFTEIRATVVDPVLQEEIIFPWVGDATGNAGEGLPSFTSMVLSLRTGLGGKSKRGRIYLAGAPETAQAASALTPGQMTALVAFVACVAAAFIGNTSAGEWNLGVYSRKLGGASGYNMSLGWTPVTTILARNNYGTTRSRKVGVGS